MNHPLKIYWNQTLKKFKPSYDFNRLDNRSRQFLQQVGFIRQLFLECIVLHILRSSIDINAATDLQLFKRWFQWFWILALALWRIAASNSVAALVELSQKLSLCRLYGDSLSAS